MNDATPHNYYVTTDLKPTDFQWALDQVRQTYFGKTRTEDQMAECARNSLSFGVFRRDYLSEGFPSHRDTMVGFCRVVTDRVLFSWLADFVIAPELRGRGLGYQLMHAVLTHHALRGTTLNLVTRDAGEFYEKFGFEKAMHYVLRLE